MAAGRVLVTQDVPSGLVEVPQQSRGNVSDERGDCGLAVLGDDPPVIRRQPLDEDPPGGAAEDGGIMESPCRT